MREFGGYIEYDEYSGDEYYTNLMRFNCGRSCLRFLFSLYKITKIYIPYYMCDTVRDSCIKDNIDYEFYHIDEEMHPILPDTLQNDSWVYIVNYYGQLYENELEAIYDKYNQRIIIDNTQAFFAKPIQNIPTIYSCRKYFGVADGAYLSIGENYDLGDYPTDVSYNRLNFIFGRYEVDASTFYGEYVNNNTFFDDEPVKRMSKITQNMLRAIDYTKVQNTREENFEFLHKRFAVINRLKCHLPVGPFMYPLLVNRGKEIRSRLINTKIYVPVLWPEVLQKCDGTSIEFNLSENLILLPIDQRYSLDDMQYIYETVINIITESE